MQRDTREELRTLLQQRSVLRGSFTLASGRVSPYYLDCKLTTLASPRGLALASELILDRVCAIRPRPDAIGGLTIGAAPLSIGVSQLAWHRLGWSLPVFVVREGRKAHGTERRVEGELRAGWRVVIVDDVMTTGNSVLTAIGAAQEAGASIARVIVLVDREEGAGDTLKDYEVERLFTYKDLLEP